MADKPDHCQAELVLSPIDACDEHADRIEKVLAKGGHQPKRVKVS